MAEPERPIRLPEGGSSGAERPIRLLEDTDNSTASRHSLRPFERIILEYAWLAQAFFLITIVAVALSAIAEIAARQSLLSLVRSEIDSLRAEVVDLTRTPPSPSDTAMAGQIAQLRRQISYLQEVERDCTSLLAVGADEADQTVWWLRRQLRPQRTSTSSTKEPYRREPIVTLGLRYVGLGVDYLPVDHLLAIAVIACGAIGSFISTVRHGRVGSMKFLVLGMASGFVAFLALKGGRHVFLVQVGTDAASLNPYSSAFAGLLAGLFTERAYHLLSSIVDKFAENWRRL